MLNYSSNTPPTVALKMPSLVGNVTDFSYTVILQLHIICLQWKSLTVCYQFTANPFFYHYLHSIITKSIPSDTLSIPFNSCNQSLPNTEIKSYWTLIPFLLNPMPNYYLTSETHHSSHFYPISSNYTIQSLTTQNCNENHPELLQITVIHFSNHPQFPHCSSSITVNHNTHPSNLLISHQSINTHTKMQLTHLTVIIFQLISTLP